MDKFDMKSTKYLAAILVICLIFVMVIANAYKYLPETELNKLPQVSEKNIPSDESAEENSDDEQDDEDEENSEEESVTQQVEPIVEATSTPAIEPAESVEETFETKFEKAKQLKTEEQYLKAIESFNNVSEQTDDSILKSNCYEEIADCYAILKRYGSALSFAQKAYNTYPSVSKEVLLARLYYKTGDTEKANRRMENILRREFVK